MTSICRSSAQRLTYRINYNGERPPCPAWLNMPGIKGDYPPNGVQHPRTRTDRQGPHEPRCDTKSKSCLDRSIERLEYPSLPGTTITLTHLDELSEVFGVPSKTSFLNSPREGRQLPPLPSQGCPHARELPLHITFTGQVILAKL